jgi:hypothetical protein
VSDIAKLTDQRQKLLAAVKRLNTDTKAKETKLLKLKAKLEAPKNLRNLLVTWLQDGEEMSVGPLVEASPVEFLKAVDAIPRSVKSKLDGGRVAQLDTIRGDLNRLPRAYKAKRRELETKIYHVDEALAKLRSEAS